MNCPIQRSCWANSARRSKHLALVTLLTWRRQPLHHLPQSQPQPQDLCLRPTSKREAAPAVASAQWVRRQYQQKHHPAQLW
jgi:hypothetical protein